MFKLSLLALLFTFSSCADSLTTSEKTSATVTSPSTIPGSAISKHTRLGLPTTPSTLDKDNYLSVKEGYVVSYNSSRKGPNWVSWELNSTYLGEVERRNNFRPDDSLPPEINQATLDDYDYSGFDRGHMCPSGDRSLHIDSNSETFLLSNILPQAKHSNRGAWADLEQESRRLVNEGKELFIIAGGVFQLGYRSIGDGLAVPDQLFKVIVILDNQNQDVTPDTQVIAVLVPNDNRKIAQTTSWLNYRVSIDSIEELTGQDIMSDISPSTQAWLEHFPD